MAAHVETRTCLALLAGGGVGRLGDTGGLPLISLPADLAACKRCPRPSCGPAVVTKVSGDELYIVVNAGCREKDLAHLGQHLDAFKASCPAFAAGVGAGL